MSCQQVPRITEDPYTFTDTAPTTATLFNPQIHKLTPIIQNTNVRQFLPKKTQIISQHPRIFNTTNANKSQKGVSVIGRLNGIPVSITSSSNNVNGIHKISVTNSSLVPSIDLIKNQNSKQKTQTNLNSLSINKSSLLAPLTKFQGQQTQISRNQQPQTLPQIVSLHQSHPLYSVARQTQIVTTSAVQGNVAYQQQKQSLKSPSIIKQNQAFPINNNAQVPGTFNEPAQKTVIANHSSGNIVSNKLPSIPFTVMSQNQQKQEETVVSQQQQTLTQRLPASNFAQPQQIKQLASTYNSDNTSINKKTNSETKSVSKKSKSLVLQQSSNAKKRKLSDDTLVTVSSLKSFDSEKKNEKPVFATPPAKRDVRTPSTGSTTGKGKLTIQNTSSNNVVAKVCNNNKTQNLARTKRAYSQSSHHETLQRISKETQKHISNWHAPDSYVFDSLGSFSIPAADLNCQLKNLERCDNFQFNNEDSIKLQVQKYWLNIENIKFSIPSWSQAREKCIELRKAQLRRQALQYYFARQFLSTTNARKRLIFVSKALKKFSDNRSECSTKRTCSIPSCKNTALVLTSFCNLHITRNNDQHLFLPCTAKFSDNTQCRIPVFDITHNLPLCKEHAWKRDNYQRILQEHKPSKNVRKRTKSGVCTKSYGNVPTNHKRNKRKRKPILASDSGLGGMEISNNSVDGLLSSGSDMGSGSVEENNEERKLQEATNPTNSINRFSDYESSTKNGLENKFDSRELLQETNVNKLLTKSDCTFKADKLPDGINDITQDSFHVGENSSVYESSEDTGFGALSDAELIGTHDAIEEIPLGDTRLLEEHDLTNVLNQLPVDAINELFTTVHQNGPLEPTQEEQEYLERALELANKQVQEQMNQMVGQQIEQMAVEGDQIDPNFLESFFVDNLDADCLHTEIVYSPNAQIDANSLLMDGESNCTTESNSCIDTSTAVDIRNLVQA